MLPIGGVKEKTLAARRSGVKTLIFPKANKYDYDELTGMSSPHGNTNTLNCITYTIRYLAKFFVMLTCSVCMQMK